MQVDTLVLHYTGMADGGDALSWLCNAATEVSAHYLVEETGQIYRLVAVDRRARHAGVSAWRGNRDINSRSIGIELVNPGHKFGYRAFPEVQIASLVGLCRDILSRHPIPPRNVIGHSDIAPMRKRDPGELFPWQTMAAAGIGPWPSQLPSTYPGNFATGLAAFGYDMANTPLEAAIAAFQRHFRPRLVDGGADDETRAILAALRDMVASTAPEA